jgi:hypothetical protein
MSCIFYQFIIGLWLGTSALRTTNILGDAWTKKTKQIKREEEIGAANHKTLIDRINAMLKRQQTADAAMVSLSKEIPALRKALLSDGQYIIVENYDEFADRYMDEYPKEKSKAKRKKMLIANKNTGMAGPSGKLYVLRSDYISHDEVHEFIHLLHGGPKNQLEKNQGIDECFTEYYAKVLCRKMNIKDSPNAYPKESDFMRRLDNLLIRELGKKESEKVLFDAFWRSHNIDGLAKRIASIHIDKARKINWDTHESYYLKGSVPKYKKRIQKNPNKKIKEPQMKKTYSTYLEIDLDDLNGATKIAKNMLMNWDEKKSEFFWQDIMGMEPGQNNNGKKKKKTKRKKAPNVSAM